jgi:hypothetical protein
VTQLCCLDMEGSQKDAFVSEMCSARKRKERLQESWYVACK